MKRKTKHILMSSTAVGLACTLTAGALLHSSVSVAASAAMPGIETIVKNTNKEAPLRILEIVDSKADAEIGYYVSGQEPYLKLFQYPIGKDEFDQPVYRSFGTVKEALSVIETAEERRAFMENVPLQEGSSTGIRNVRALCGENVQENPLAWEEYQEYYFLPQGEDTDSWQRVGFENNKVRTAVIEGSYVAVEPGQGDYSAGEQQFYPVRADVASDAAKANYKENITGFQWNGNGFADHAYEVDFQPVKDETGNPVTNFTEGQVTDAYRQGNYGYYTNVYKPLTTQTDFTTFPGEKVPVIEGMLSAEQVVPEVDFAAPAEFGDGSFADFAEDVELVEPDLFSAEEFTSEASAAEFSVNDENPMLYIYESFVSGEELFWRYKKYKTLQEVEEERFEGKVVLDSEGNYQLLIDDSGNTQPLYYVESRQPVSREEVRNLPSNYYGDAEFNAGENDSNIAPYYYQVNKGKLKFSASFSGRERIAFEDAEKYPEAYAYTGWYASITSEERKYVEAADGETSTYYASEEEYTLTPGAGDYNFVPGEGENQKVQVNHLYYRGGYKNHDWFKRFVFHLMPEDEKFENFDIQVDTLTTAEFENNLANGVFHISSADEVSEEVPQVFTDESATEGELFLSQEGVSEVEIIEAGDIFGDTSEVAPMISESSEELVSFEMFEEAEDLVVEDAAEEEVDVFSEFRDTELLETEEDESNDFEDSAFYEDEEAEANLFSDSIDLAAAFSSGEKQTRLAGLQNYDLIYINGCLLTDAAAAIADSGISCIVNQDKALSENGSGIRSAFQTYWKDNDADGHYVKQNIYFFRNTDVTEEGASQVSSLVSGTFNQNFNRETDAEIERFSDGEVPAGVEGFEEILEYIESENQFRELDGALETEFLAEEISVARAVEYVLNYKYRRKLRDGITRVLELQPARSGGQIEETDVFRWITGGEYGKQDDAEADGPVDIPNIEIETMTISEFVGHVEDINSKYDLIYLGNDDSDLNYFGNFRPNGSVLYYHIGSDKLARYELQGLMNHDYVIHGNGNKSAAAVGSTDENGNVIGSVRGSGNDITKQVKQKLVDFAMSNYPVVVAGDIYTENKEQVSTELVDNSSYIYDFLDAVKVMPNVVREQDIKEGADVGFYINLPKPQIVFEEADGVPPSIIGDSNGPSREYLNSSDLVFRFKIEDEAEVSPADTSYDCRVFLDLNCDGNFSGTERLKDLSVVGREGTLQPDEEGKYRLRIGETYTVARVIPMEYVKLLPWKLVIENNENQAVRTSEVGYTKHYGRGEENLISVLQITPNSGCNWDLSTDREFRRLLDNVSDFQVEITSVTIETYQKELAKMGQQYLNQYHMLILGFCDGTAYGKNDSGNFSEAGAEAIFAFAKTGKSVIFAHDNTSASNYDRTAQDGGTDGNKTWKGWAYYFNQKLRTVSGMDRYGITDAQYSGILKEANPLDMGSTDWAEISGSNYDMGYAFGQNKGAAYGETHGFTNGKLQIAVQGQDINTPIINTVSQVNQGAISEYPYKIDPTFRTASTHMQYYQLALEGDADRDGTGDVVVWYCLGDKGNTNSYYDHSPNDVRNNYYIYSYKNIIYTGVGHSADITEMEKKLFVNTIIAAYNANTVSPDISFVESDWDSEEEQDTYYTLDSILSNEDSNLISDALQFNMRVRDTNLAGQMGVDIFRNLKLELFVENPDGDEVPGIGAPGVHVSKLNDVEVFVKGSDTPIGKNDDGEMYVQSGNIYTFTLPEPRLLKNQSGDFRNIITLYAKISTEFLYYGETRTAYDAAQINVRKRQLFDMD